LKQQFLALKNHAGFIRYFKNSSWMLGEQMLRMVAGLLVGIWVARYLGPEQFGIFSYVIALTAPFSSITKLGLDSIMVRELVKHPDRHDMYLGTAFWMKVLGAFLVMALIALALPWTSNNSTTTLYIFIIASGLIFQSFEVVDFYFQSQVLAKFVSICKIIQLILSSLLKLYLIFINAELIWFVWVTLFDQSTLAITLYFSYRYQNTKFLPLRHFSLVIVKKLLQDSWPLILVSLAVTIHMRIDQIMIKEMLGDYEVGIYSVGFRLSELWYFLPVLITSSIFPAIINAKKNSEALYLQRLQRLYKLMVWSAIAIAVPITLLSDWLIVLLYGEAYQVAGTVLAIHIWTVVFVFIGISGSKWMLIENIQYYANYFVIIGLSVNVISNLILIPVYGVVGAAVSIVVSQIASSYLAPYLFKSTRLRSQMFTKAVLFTQQIQR
jgi:O-antigen/teichoic acid export membrane protein